MVKWAKGGSTLKTTQKWFVHFNVHLLSSSYTISRWSSIPSHSPEPLSSPLGSSPVSLGRGGVCDFLNVSFTSSAGWGDAPLLGKVSVTASAVLSGWVNSSVMLFSVGWRVPTGVTDACEVAVVTGWVFTFSLTVSSGTEPETDDEDVPRPTAPPVVMTSLTDWPPSVPLFALG